MRKRFDITFDYLCPFARNANEAVVEGINAGADWDVTFRPFSLAQTKVEPEEPPVWNRQPEDAGMHGVLALQWGIAVRDGWPDRFFDFHVALFAARRERGIDIGDDEQLAAVANGVGLDARLVFAEVESRRPIAELAAEHQALVADAAVFGVPTLIADGEAVFVRLMDRHQPDEISRVVSMIGWTGLNEFKRTRIPR